MSSGNAVDSAQAGLPVAVADADMLFRGALQHAADALGHETRLSFFADFQALRKTLSKPPLPDLILVDATVTGLGGLRGVLALRSVAPKVPFAIVSHHMDAAFISSATFFGAAGFLSKNLRTGELAASVTRLLSGDKIVPATAKAHVPDAATRSTLDRCSKLTHQQMRVLGFLADGLLNKQIAYELNVSEATVKAHVSAILAKLDVPSRREAVAAVTMLNSGDHSGEMRF
jgi:DNA-binding NarL/FixJ family response regulator